MRCRLAKGKPRLPGRCRSAVAEAGRWARRAVRGVPGTVTNAPFPARQQLANSVPLRLRKGGRAVQGTGLENRGRPSPLVALALTWHVLARGMSRATMIIRQPVEFSPRSDLQADSGRRNEL